MGVNTVSVWTIIYDIFIWSFVVFITFHLIRNRNHRTSKPELDSLRAEAVRLIGESDRPEYDKVPESSLLHHSDGESLKLFIRMEGKFPAYNLSSMVNNLRLERMAYRSNLVSHKLTKEQVQVYTDLIETQKEVLSHVIYDPKKYRSERRKLIRTAAYAMEHMDNADEITALVKSRGVYQLKHVKALLGQMQESTALPLSEGML